MEPDRRPERADDVKGDEQDEVDPMEGDSQRSPIAETRPSGGTITAMSVTIWLIRLVCSRTVATAVRVSRACPFIEVVGG